MQLRKSRRHLASEPLSSKDEGSPSSPQVANFFGVTERTIDDQIASHSAELVKNGYEVVRSKRLKDLKKIVEEAELDEINFVQFKHTQALAIFDFRAFLNLAMLLPNSERARQLRSLILDINRYDQC